MSVATEFAPTVVKPEAVPERARRTGPQLVSVPAPLATVSMLYPPAPRPVAPSKLTRRGVLVLAAVVVAVGLALSWVAHLDAPGAGAAAPTPPPAAVTVQAGDTLWSIASTVAPDVDPRLEVAALQRRNRLAGVDLRPGQVLMVPER